MPHRASLSAPSPISPMLETLYVPSQSCLARTGRLQARRMTMKSRPIQNGKVNIESSAVAPRDELEYLSRNRRRPHRDGGPSIVPGYDRTHETSGLFIRHDGR